MRIPRTVYLVSEWDKLVIDGRVFECRRFECKDCPDVAVCDAMARRTWLVEYNKEKKVIQISTGMDESFSISLNEFAFLGISHGSYGKDWFFFDYETIVVYQDGEWIKKPRYSFV